MHWLNSGLNALWIYDTLFYTYSISYFVNLLIYVILFVLNITGSMPHTCLTNLCPPYSRHILPESMFFRNSPASIHSVQTLIKLIVHGCK